MRPRPGCGGIVVVVIVLLHGIVGGLVVDDLGAFIQERERESFVRNIARGNKNGRRSKRKRNNPRRFACRCETPEERECILSSRARRRQSRSTPVDPRTWGGNDDDYDEDDYDDDDYDEGGREGRKEKLTN